MCKPHMPVPSVPLDKIPLQDLTTPGAVVKGDATTSTTKQSGATPLKNKTILHKHPHGHGHGHHRRHPRKPH
jgi:hypothetical protein